MSMKPFHLIKNAASALEPVTSHTDVQVVEVNESLRKATIEFRFGDGISISGMKGIDQTLTGAGWKEVTNESQAYRRVKYKVDLARLVQDHVEEMEDSA